MSEDSFEKFGDKILQSHKASCQGFRWPWVPRVPRQGSPEGVPRPLKVSLEASSLHKIIGQGWLSQTRGVQRLGIIPLSKAAFGLKLVFGLVCNGKNDVLG